MSNKPVTQWTRPQLEDALRDHLLAVRDGKDLPCTEVVTDSRKIEPGCVFVALKGERFDGQDFAAQAAREGAACLVVRAAVDAECVQYIVDDTLEAYGALAHAWRRRFSLPLIEVAGANGKTSTTQMCARILAAHCGEEGALATQGNFNNAVGVPRTLLRLAPQHTAAVVEAGISHPGEMAQLVSWIRPTVVVITNAQREHQEFLNGTEASARENGLALVSLKKSQTAVLPAADEQLPIWMALVRARGCRVLTYAAEGLSADVMLQERDGGLVLVTPQGEAKITLHAPGAHMRHDAAAAAAACLAAGVPLAAVKKGLEAFALLPGRGAQMELASGAKLIDDSYNANPDSMRAGIDVLCTMPSPRVLVAGDMAETGAHSEAYHEEVGRYARKQGVDELLCCGAACQAMARAFGAKAQHFDSVSELAQAAQAAAQKGGTLLVKASHSSGLQAVVAHLKETIGIKKQEE